LTEKIIDWGEWQPTGHLRWNHEALGRKILQQLFQKKQVSRGKYVRIDPQEEWREVEEVYDPPRDETGKLR